MLTGQADNEPVRAHRVCSLWSSFFSFLLSSFSPFSSPPSAWHGGTAVRCYFPRECVPNYTCPRHRDTEGRKRRRSPLEASPRRARALNARATRRCVKIKIVSFITFISFDASANGAHAPAAVLPLGLLLGVQSDHGARGCIRAGRTTINYNSVLSYTGCTVTARLTPHALRPCDSFRASSSHISPRNIFHRGGNKTGHEVDDDGARRARARARGGAHRSAHRIHSRGRGRTIAGLADRQWIASTRLARNDYSRSNPRNDDRCSRVCRFLQVDGDSWRLSTRVEHSLGTRCARCEFRASTATKRRQIREFLEARIPLAFDYLITSLLTITAVASSSLATPRDAPADEIDTRVRRSRASARSRAETPHQCRSTWLALN